MTDVYFQYHLGDNTLEVSATVSPIVPAQTYGPAEDCYPAEGGEAEITDVYIICAGMEYSFDIDPIYVLCYINTVTGKMHRQSLEEALEEAALEAWMEQGS